MRSWPQHSPLAVDCPLLDVSHSPLQHLALLVSPVGDQEGAEELKGSPAGQSALEDEDLTGHSGPRGWWQGKERSHSAMGQTG